MTTRQVAGEMVWKVARNTLGRLACEHDDPAALGHVHEDCLVDDESYAADAMLGLLHAVAQRDEDRALDRLTSLLAAVREP